MNNNKKITQEGVTRRSFIKNGLILGATAATGLITPKAEAASGFAQQLFRNVKEPKIISLRNLHTGEVFNGAYSLGGEYISESLEKLSHVLRDHRTGDTHEIDKDLIEYVHQLKIRADSDYDFEVLSGYRSPKTNAMLRRNTSGVAKKSFHMEGKAMDVRLAGFSTKRLRQHAEGLRLGGVGYYPDSGFVHLDTGPVRHW